MEFISGMYVEQRHHHYRIFPMISDISDDIGHFRKIPFPRFATKWHQYFMHVMNAYTGDLNSVFSALLAALLPLYHSCFLNLI
jgi:hypothetical protein